MEIRPLDLSPAGLARTAGLLAAVFPRARHIDAAYLDRLYNGNPVGPTTGLAAFSDAGELIGHYLMIPVRSIVHGEVEDGIWPFQLAVHPDHRGRSVFTALVDGSRELMDAAGYSYIVGVTNDQSAPIYQKRFGCQLICQLDVKIGFGPAPAGRPLDDPEYRRVWSREGVAWRCGLPPRSYRVARRGGRARIYAHTGRWGIWCEVASFPAADVPPELPRFSAPNPLRLWIGSDPGRDWSRSPYVDVPKRLRASPLHLTFGDFSGRGRRFDPRRVEFQVFDFDAY